MSLDAPKLHWFSLRTRMHSKSRFVLYKESIYVCMHSGLENPQSTTTKNQTKTPLMGKKEKERSLIKVLR